MFSFFLICFILFTFTYANKNFLKSDLFAIKEVSVEGDIGFLRKEISNQIDVLNGTLIWDVNIDGFKEMLEEDVRVEKVEIEKIIPNRLEIKIESKNPKYYVLFEEKMYLLDEENNIFSYSKEFPLRDNPILSIKNSDEIEELIEILEKIKGRDLEKLVSQLYMEDENCINIVLTDGTLIKTRKEVARDKYILLERLFSQLKTDENPLEYIDIRFSDYIVK